MNMDFRNYMVLTSKCGQGIMGGPMGIKVSAIMTGRLRLYIN